MPRPKIQVECSECRKPIVRHQQGPQESGRYFCSNACSRIWQQKHTGVFVYFPCDTCGNPVRRKRSDRKTEHHFCNHACNSAWKSQAKSGTNSYQYNSQEVSCMHCGKTFLLPQSRIKKAKQHFCSVECHAPYLRGEHSGRWKGGHPGYYGPNWGKQRTAAIKRDSRTCQHCGKHGGWFRLRILDVHHIVPFREFAYLPDQNENYLLANRLENLITLCQKCHGLAETGRITIQPKLL